MAEQEVGNLAVKVDMDLTGFQNGISNLNQQMRVVQSEFQAATGGLGNFEKTTEGLRLKVDSLNKQIDLQKQKVAALEGAYQKSVETKGADARATQDLEIKLNKARAALASMETDLKSTTATLEKQSSVWYQAAQRAEAAGNKMKSAGETMGKVGKTLSIAVTLPLVGIGTAVTKMAMDAVESENLFEVSMGNMASAARAWSEDISKSLGLNAFEVRKNVATFNVMLNSMGLTEKQAYDMSTSMTKLAYDMASFYNLEPEEAFEKLRAGISGETEPLKELGINLLDTQVQTYAFTNGIAKQGTQLTEQQKIMARYGLLMQSTSKAQGDLARTIDSPTNKVRIITQQVQQLGIQFGQLLIPALERLLATIKPVVDWFSSLTTGQQQMIINLAMVAAVIGPVVGTIGKLVSTVGDVAKGFSSVATSISSAGGVIAFVSNPVGIAIVAIAALATAAYLIIKNWDSIKAFFTNLWENIKNVFQTACIAIVNFLQQWGPLILAAVTGPIGLIIYAVVKNWDEIKAKTAEIWNAIKDSVVNAFQWMYDHNYYFQHLVDAIRKAWNTLKTATEQVWNTLKPWLQNIWQSISGTASSVWNGIYTILSGITSRISSTIQSAWNSIAGATRSAWGQVSNTISGIASSIWSTLSGLASRAWDWGANLMSNFINGIRSYIDRLKSIVSEAMQAVYRLMGFHSPAAEGPGKDADKWAPNLVQMYAEGIRKGIPDVRAAVTDLARSLSNLLPVSPILAGSGGGIVIQNMHVRSDQDIERVAQRLYQLQQGRLRGQGR